MQLSDIGQIVTDLAGDKHFQDTTLDEFVNAKPYTGL